MKPVRGSYCPENMVSDTAEGTNQVPQNTGEAFSWETPGTTEGISGM